MNKLYTILDTNYASIEAIPLPGGLLMITETIRESGNGIAIGLATSFVPMPTEERDTFLKALAEEKHEPVHKNEQSEEARRS